jgi:hypothetical protein
MYSKIAEDEDSQMAKRWQKDAQGIILFVGPHLSSRTTTAEYVNGKIVDRFIRRLRRCIDYSVGPGPQKKPPRYHRVPSR